MGLLQWVLFWFLAPAAALALDLSPAETPPEDFPGQQYIDSRGCVFLRDADSWKPRQTRDGQPVCGYPPSLSQRGIDGRPRLRALDPDAGKSRAQLIEEALTRAVVPNLRAGELVSDARPLATLPDMGPEPSDSAPMDTLRVALRAAPGVRESMSRDLQPNRRLCALLGYDDSSAGKTQAVLGRDPSQGYCGSLPDPDLSRLAFVRPIGTPLQPEKEARPTGSPVKSAGRPRDAVQARPAPVAAMASAPPVPRPVADAKKPAAAPKKVAANPAPVTSTPPKQGAATPAPSAGGNLQRSPLPPVGLIPAGARYVELGHFATGPAADAAAQKALSLGYPVLRGKGQGKTAFLLAGPFQGREAIVRALYGLRKAGFHAAVPR